jgi:hypothetical protein
MPNVIALLPGDGAWASRAHRLLGVAPSRGCATWAELDAAVRGCRADLVVAVWDGARTGEARSVLAGLRAAHPTLLLAIAHTGTAAQLDDLAGVSALRLGLVYVGTDGGILRLLLDDAGSPPQCAGPSAAELLMPEIVRWVRGRASRAIALHAALSPTGRWALNAVAGTCGVSLRTAQDQLRASGLSAKRIWESCLAFHGAALLETYPRRSTDVAAALGVPVKRLRTLIRRAFGRAPPSAATLAAEERLTLWRERMRGISMRPLRPSEVRFRVPAQVGAVVGGGRAGISDRRTGARHVLTGVTAEVWPLVLQGGSVAEITGWIARRRGLARPVAYAEVNAAIARLIELGLIEFEPGALFGATEPG